MTRFQRPENGRFFLFPYVFCSLERGTAEERSDFVTVFVTKNVISVTIATNGQCNSLIISYAYRVQKSPWKVHDILHRKIISLN